jgi:hypothetical protein
MGREAIAEALGHSSSSSAVAIKIGTLTHFGLLTRNGNVYQQSQLAKDILVPKSDADRSDAIAKAAKSPGLYRRLVKDFSGKALPGMLENILHRDYGVARSNAGDVVKTFRTTMVYAGLLNSGVLYENAVDDEPAPREEDQSQSHAADEPRERVPTAMPSVAPVVAQSSQMAVYTIPLTQSVEAILHIPKPVLPKHLTRIEKWLELMRDMLLESDENEE